MAILELVYIPNKTLKKVAKPIETVDEEIKTLAKDMLETMYAKKGLGLAANQVGVLLRIFVCDIPIEHKNEETQETVYESNPVVFINPEIIEHSTDMEESNEGCLSIPRTYEPKSRYTSIKVKYLDENGKEQIIEATGLKSRCIQHEIDHLNGILFIDGLSGVKRDIIARKVKKYLENPEKYDDDDDE